PFVVEARALPPGAGAPEGRAKERAMHRARAEGVKPGTSGLELVLRAPEGVAGRVVDEAGAPVAKFELQAKRQGKGMLGSLGQEETRDEYEDPQGRFLFTGLVEGTWRIYAVADGFGLPD